jgi:hypothetical protein
MTTKPAKQKIHKRIPHTERRKTITNTRAQKRKISLEE